MDNQFQTITKAEFALLLKALDALPSLHSTADVLADMLVKSFGPDPRIQDEYMKVKAKARKEREDLMEDLGVLRGKIIQIKRNLEMEGLLKDADHIINS